MQQVRPLVLAAKGGSCPGLPDLSALALGDLFRVFLAALVAGNAEAAARCAAVAQAREAPPDELARFFASGLQFAAAAGRPTLFEAVAVYFEAAGCGREVREVRGAALSAVMAAAAGRDDILTMERCSQRGAADFNQAMAAAAAKGRLAAMEWCRERGASDFGRAMAAAAAEGRLLAMAWCSQHGAADFNQAMAAAAAKGRLAAMEWCRERGASDFGRAMAAAAARGRFAAIAWCSQRGAANFEKCVKVIAEAAPGARLSYRASDYYAPASLRAKGKSFHTALKWCLSAAGWGEAARAAGRTGRVDAAEWCFKHRMGTQPGVRWEDLIKEILTGAAESEDVRAVVEWGAEILLAFGDRTIAQVCGALSGEGPLKSLLERALADRRLELALAASEPPGP